MISMSPIVITGGHCKTGRRMDALRKIRTLATRSASQALGRPPRDFSNYVRKAATDGAWSME